jgi:UDP-N-acetylglucosamine:LPS N-acetylglucosamine transferase
VPPSEADGSPYGASKQTETKGPQDMPKFNAVDNEIYVTHEDGQKVRTLVVVGGSFSIVGLAREIADALNRHYDKK